MIDYALRLQQVREYMSENGVDALFLCPSGDAEYLTGIRRQRPNATHTHYPGDWLYGLWVNQTDAVYLSPRLPLEFVEDQIRDKPYVTDLMVMRDGHDSFESARKIVSRLGLETGCLALTKDCKAKTALTLKQLFPQMSFTATEDYTLKRRMVKDDDEIDFMRHAAELTDQVFDNVYRQLKMGMTEIEIAKEVDYQMLLAGGEGSSFNTGIMIRGKGKPKEIEGIGRAGNATLTPGSTLAFDFGLVSNGFVSDFGRTVYIGEPSPKMTEIHKLVMEAQKVGMEAMLPGRITAEELNRTARKVIDDAGYQKEFFHRLGHGIGIDTHEYPFLDKGYSEMMQANMCFTVEPSILIPDVCWIRVEDVVRCTPQGGESLNRVTRDMLVLA